MGSITEKPLRIASASGSVTDRRHALADLAKNEDVEFIVGDWLSEYNMTTRGGAKVDSDGASDEFETSFLEALDPALVHLDSGKARLVVNAGASDTKKLHDIVVEKVAAAGLDLKVAWIGGDEVFDVVNKAISQGDVFKSLTHGKLNDVYKICAADLYRISNRRKPLRLGSRSHLRPMLPRRLGHCRSTEARRRHRLVW